MEKRFEVKKIGHDEEFSIFVDGVRQDWTCASFGPGYPVVDPVTGQTHQVLFVQKQINGAMMHAVSIDFRKPRPDDWCLNPFCTTQEDVVGTDMGLRCKPKEGTFLFFDF